MARPEFYIHRIAEPTPRVVITGIGAIYPNSSEDGEPPILFEKDMKVRLAQGKPIYGRMPDHIQKLAPLRTTDSCAVGAFFPENFDPLSTLDPRFTQGLKEPRTDRTSRLAAVAAIRAVNNACLDIAATGSENVGVAFSDSTGPVGLIEEAAREIGYKREHTADTSRKRKLQAALTATTGNGLSDNIDRIVGKITGARGEMINSQAACAGFGVDFTLAADTIRAGKADAMIVGGAETTSGEVFASTFDFAGVMARGFNHDPLHASRPMDTRRSGLIASEGAVAVILERLDNVVQSGREHFIIAEVLHGATRLDPEGVTQSPDGQAFKSAIQASLSRSGLAESGSDVTFPHMTGTISGDPIEAAAIVAINPKSIVFGPKCITAHGFARAAGDNILASDLVFNDNCFPAQVNLDQVGTFKNGQLIQDALQEIRQRTLNDDPKHVNVITNQSLGMSGQANVVQIARYKKESPL